MLNDKFSTSLKAKGYFKIETLDKSGNVLDNFEEDNLIMNLARQNMCELIAGVAVGAPINKFVLGTGGHQGAGTGSENVLIPVALDDPTRTNLFAEELSLYTYPIGFEGTGDATGGRLVTSEPTTKDPLDPSTYSTVTISQTGTNVEYVIYLPTGVANNTGTTAYTEAGFYCGSDLFNMKTFAAKVKNSSVSIRITWRISF